MVAAAFQTAHAAKAKKLAIKEGMTLPEVTLSGAKTAEIQEYLGIEGSEPFQLFQIKANLLLVEFYSLYCPVCQKSAPKVNKLFKYIQGNSQLKDDIKMLGIALTNKPFEVDMYRQKFKVKFPLFPDADKAITDTLKITWTPLMVLMNMEGKVLLAHYGEIKDLEEFIHEVQEIYKAL
jgi:thiol-disulfide isomerase/thioredoxin